jgi:hypothetical protein
VAKTFALAIEEAAKLHPAAEPLIVHSAFLAAEPIPLFLFSEAREKFGEPLATALAGDGLDEAVAALRGFALIDRETIVYQYPFTAIQNWTSETWRALLGHPPSITRWRGRSTAGSFPVRRTALVWSIGRRGGETCITDPPEPV